MGLEGNLSAAQILESEWRGGGREHDSDYVCIAFPTTTGLEKQCFQWALRVGYGLAL